MALPISLPTVGQRFSHAYLNRGDAVSDSPRMRRRIASTISTFRDLTNSEAPLSEEAEARLGIQGPWSSVRDWTYFLERWELRDVLDLVTIAWRFLDKKLRHYDPNAKVKWIAAINEIFADENVHYRVDDRGGVHFSLDKEFAHNTSSTIAALNSSRYDNSRQLFESALRCLSIAPPDTVGAIRATFFSAEGLFRLMFPDEPRLAAKAANLLLPRAQDSFGDDRTAKIASAKMLNSAKEWIEASHFYRHEQGIESPMAPPLYFSIHMISTGASFIRWLAELDGLQQM